MRMLYRFYHEPLYMCVCVCWRCVVLHIHPLTTEAHRPCFYTSTCHSVIYEVITGKRKKVSLLLPDLSFLRSSVCVGPEELLWPSGLQRRRASLCLTKCPLGISRGAPSLRVGLLLLPVHPWVALWRRSGVRKATENETFVLIVPREVLWRLLIARDVKGHL